jgi:hypothetical protein
MNNCELKEIIVVEGFEVKNGVFGLCRDIYLSIVKFLDSSIVRKVYFICFILLIFFLSTLELVKNVMNKWNTSTL